MGHNNINHNGVPNSISQLLKTPLSIEKKKFPKVWKSKWPFSHIVETPNYFFSRIDLVWDLAAESVQYWHPINKYWNLEFSYLSLSTVGNASENEKRNGTRFWTLPTLKIAKIARRLQERGTLHLCSRPARRMLKSLGTLIANYPNRWIWYVSDRSRVTLLLFTNFTYDVQTKYRPATFSELHADDFLLIYSRYFSRNQTPKRIYYPFPAKIRQAKGEMLGKTQSKKRLRACECDVEEEGAPGRINVYS